MCKHITSSFNFPYEIDKLLLRYSQCPTLPITAFYACLTFSNSSPVLLLSPLPFLSSSLLKSFVEQLPLTIHHILHRRYFHCSQNSREIVTVLIYLMKEKANPQRNLPTYLKFCH